MNNQSPIIRVVIVEDHPTIAEDIASMLQLLSGFYVVAICKSVAETIPVIGATQPDVVLMDIQLKDGSAFDILEQLVPLPFKVIFLTSFEQYAIRAIKFGALDYLIKPTSVEELELALQKCNTTANIGQRQLSIAQQWYGTAGGARIALREGPYLHMLSLSEISYVTGGTRTVFIKTDGTRICVAKRLKEFMDLFPIKQFLRPHQSYLVNIDSVSRYHKDGYLLLRSNEEIPVSERLRSSIMSALTQY